MINHTNILYELNTPKFSKIKEIIIEFNNLGFYTSVSQPGIQTLNKDCIERKQRSYVRGYMKSELANYLVNELEKHENIFVRSSEKNKTLDPNVECTCGSVLFKNNMPCTMNFNIGEFDQSFNFTLPLRHPIKTSKTYFDFLVDISNIHNIDDYIELDILDLRWNNNEMWEIIMYYIKNYNYFIK